MGNRRELTTPAVGSARKEGATTKGYEIYLDKLVLDSIETKSSLTDILFGIKEISGKLDTLISLKEVELGRQQLRQEQQSQN